MQLLVLGEGDGEERRVERRAGPGEAGFWPLRPVLPAATTVDVLVVVVLEQAQAARTRIAAAAEVAGGW